MMERRNLIAGLVGGTLSLLLSRSANAQSTPQPSPSSGKTTPEDQIKTVTPGTLSKEQIKEFARVLQGNRFTGLSTSCTNNCSCDEACGCKKDHCCESKCTCDGKGTGMIDPDVLADDPKFHDILKGFDPNTLKSFNDMKSLSNDIKQQYSR